MIHYIKFRTDSIIDDNQAIEVCNKIVDIIIKERYCYEVVLFDEEEIKEI